MATIPTVEPASVVAGDTVTWSKSLSEYPATVWTLKYRLLNAAGKIDITATASGTDYLVSVSSTTSAGWAAGDYDYLAWVEKAGERVSVGSGRITVKPNLAALNTYDGRSPARKIYEGLLAAYQTAVTARAFVAEYEIAGRRMKFNNKSDWLVELNHWKAQVAAEDRAEKIADGLGGGARVLVRF
jgi:hypothetical protein